MEKCVGMLKMIKQHFANNDNNTLWLTSRIVKTECHIAQRTVKTNIYGTSQTW